MKNRAFILLLLLLLALFIPGAPVQAQSINCRVQVSGMVDRCVQTGSGCPVDMVPSKSCSDYRLGQCPSSIPCRQLPVPESNLCSFAGDKRTECLNCIDGKKGAWTAIGCIKTNTPGAFISQFLSFGIGIGGGIAFLLILFGGFQIMTAAGNPERMNEGKEVVSSAIAGLLMIIFSVLILKVIGVDILGIPGFKST